MPDQYWKTDGALHAVGRGIRIYEPQDIEEANERGQVVNVIRAPVNFQTYTRDCLNLLYRTAPGRTVLNYLTQAGDCTIGFSQANSAGVGNAQASMTLVAYEVAHQGRPGVATRAAMQGISALDNALGGARILSQRINSQPRWRLDWPPGSDGGWLAGFQSVRDYANRWLLWSSDPTEGYFDKQRLASNVGQSGAGLAITPLEAKDWVLNGNAPRRLGAPQLEQLRLATVVALEPYSQAGAGSPSAVRFATGAHDAYRHQRPSAIALGHELIHAYYSKKGQQPGEEVNHFSTVLFEFKCVGLGPWNEKPVSENGLRAAWSQVLPYVNVNDAPNRISPGKRIRY